MLIVRVSTVFVFIMALNVTEKVFKSVVNFIAYINFLAGFSFYRVTRTSYINAYSEMLFKIKVYWTLRLVD